MTSGRGFHSSDSSNASLTLFVDRHQLTSVGNVSGGRPPVSAPGGACHLSDPPSDEPNFTQRHVDQQQQLQQQQHHQHQPRCVPGRLPSELLSPRGQRTTSISTHTGGSDSTVNGAFLALDGDVDLTALATPMRSRVRRTISRLGNPLLVDMMNSDVGAATPVHQLSLASGKQHRNLLFPRTAQVSSAVPCFTIAQTVNLYHLWGIW